VSDEWIWRGIVFEYPIDQAVIFNGVTGKVLSKVAHIHGVAVNDTYIVMLDQPQSDGTKAVITHADALRLLSCHWCRDTHVVAVTPFTTEQYDTNAIPTKACPYCTERPARVL
jgi:hypothetical protein